MPRITTSKAEPEIDDLVLDLDNPRTGTVTSQAEALEAIVKLNVQHFRNMMISIKENDLDPGDSFYVIENNEEPDTYIVVDGNRRLAALKVLSNPSFIDGTELSDNIKKRIREIAAGFVAVGPISCVVFETRADANEWIERRHGKGLEGEGRIPWGTLESERFQKDRTVLDVIEFVEKNSTFLDSDWNRIKKSIQKSPTTLRRFLVSKPGRQHIGFASAEQDKGPTFKRDPKIVLAILSQLFSDIDAAEVTSRTHNTASEISDWFTSLPSDSGKGKADEGNPQLFASTLIEDGTPRPRQAAKAASIATIKTKKVSPQRVTLAPTRHSFAEPATEKGQTASKRSQQAKIEGNTSRLRISFSDLH